MPPDNSLSFLGDQNSGGVREAKAAAPLRTPASPRPAAAGPFRPGGWGWPRGRPPPHQAPQRRGPRMTSEAGERAERRRRRRREGAGGAARESARPPRAPTLRPSPPAPRPCPPGPCTAAGAARGSPARLLHLLHLLLLSLRLLRLRPHLLPLRRCRTRSRRPGPGRSWGVRTRSQPFPLRLPHRRPPPPLALLSPPCSFAASSSSSFFTPPSRGPGCQHHVRRGRFWKPTEKIQVGVPGGAER